MVREVSGIIVSFIPFAGAGLANGVAIQKTMSYTPLKRKYPAIQLESAI